MKDPKFVQERHPHLEKMRQRIAKEKRLDTLLRIADEEVVRERWRRFGRNMGYEERFLDAVMAKEMARTAPDKKDDGEPENG